MMTTSGQGNEVDEGTSAGPSGEPNTMFSVTDPGFQQAVNASIVENI